MADIMRHSKAYREKCSRMGKRSQEVQENKRLSAAIGYQPLTSYLVLEMDTHNPRTGTKHHIELRHDPGNGNDRYNVYLDGEKWRNNWSRTRFTNWLFGQIDSVRQN